MLFNSLQFVIFFPILWAIYLAVPFPRRYLVLLIGSLYFYAAYRPIHVLLLMVTLVVDYLAGRALERWREPRAGWLIAATSLTVNLGILFTFKYLGFAIDSLNAFLSLTHGSPPFSSVHLDLPVGISFYTFQSLSYVLDARRGQVAIERNPLMYFTYVSFFPQLVAGPIERAGHLLPQFRRPRQLDFSAVRSSMQIILWGLFKKVVLADNARVVVETVYANPEQFTGIGLATATLFFAFQIYGDFSGYTDIAIGIARLLGFELMANFRQPYLARSIPEFWQRWHISLTTWFRDYIYIPLGGNRKGDLLWARNVIIVFLLSGLWHGANWTFIAWGALHASYFLIGRAVDTGRVFLERRFSSLRIILRWRFLEWASTMGLVLIGWVFFRATSIDQAVDITRRLLQPGPVGELFQLGLSRIDFALATLWILIVMLVDRQLDRPVPWVTRQWQRRVVRHVCYQFLFWTIIFFGVFESVKFIYFTF
jgi:alginate O-acetyltransferase complex protein AlgI